MNKAEQLRDKGYEVYRFIIKSNWNPEAKKQASKILDTHKDNVIFKTGSYLSDECSFYIKTNFNYKYLRSNFNCLKVGGCDIRFVKDMDFKNEIILSIECL